MSTELQPGDTKLNKRQAETRLAASTSDDKVITEDCEGCHGSEDRGMKAVHKRWALVGTPQHLSEERGTSA